MYIDLTVHESSDNPILHYPNLLVEGGKRNQLPDQGTDIQHQGSRVVTRMVTEVKVGPRIVVVVEVGIARGRSFEVLKVLEHSGWNHFLTIWI